MLDTKAITELVKQEISKSVNDHVGKIFSSDEWLVPLETRLLKYSQERILSKFANVSSMPEIIEAVRIGISKLFEDGNIPGIDKFIDNQIIKQGIDIAVAELVQDAISELSRDSAWVEKIERMINQAVVQRTVASLGSIDLNTIIHQRVDENVVRFKDELTKNFNSSGISDQATSCQLTIMDNTTVFENTLTTRSIDVVDTAVIKDLIVKGSINTDNRSWQALAASISEKTLEQLSPAWRSQLIEEVKQSVVEQGINFENVTVDGEKLINGNQLNKKITETNIQTTGVLKSLNVGGEAQINNTAYVVNKRVGVNTPEPEMALSIWDEEISIVIGKNKAKQAYIGTNRDQGIAIGVNRLPQIEITTDGLTIVKKLQVGLHKINHGANLPNYSGTRGDIVFNSNPNDSVFAWVCLGGYKWKVLKAVE